MRNYIESDFEEIFNTYYKPICYFLNLYSKDEHVIKDIAQDVFYSLWANRELLKIDDIKAYLYTAARNRILNYFRDIKLHEQLLAKWMSEEKELADAYDCVDKTEFEKSVETAIESLSPKCKKVFKLSRYNRMSYIQIAEQEGISEKMVEKHVSTALKKIKAYILKSMPQWIIFFICIQ
ncbi:MAG: RNA polymerase sigma-70 factor [Prevotella sp.]|jgi:RNA polymerase sigma-70 factor (ECF subfamily)|nr:RNA polymerase sigma-70 factor [Prevotella sp.]